LLKHRLCHLQNCGFVINNEYMFLS